MEGVVHPGTPWHTLCPTNGMNAVVGDSTPLWVFADHVAQLPRVIFHLVQFLERFVILKLAIPFGSISCCRRTSLKLRTALQTYVYTRTHTRADADADARTHTHLPPHTKFYDSKYMYMHTRAYAHAHAHRQHEQGWRTFGSLNPW